MAQELRAQAALLEDGPGFNSQHRQGGSKSSVSLFQCIQPLLLEPEGTRHACGAQIYMQAKHPFT